MRRWLPVFAILLIALAPAVAYRVVRLREQRLIASYVAARVAETVRRQVQERPTLWRYDTLKLLSHLRTWRENPDVIRVEIADARGALIDLPGAGRSTYDASPGAAWESAPIRAGGRPLGAVWVAVDVAGVRAWALVLLVGFGGIGLAVSWLLLRLEGKEQRLRDLSARALALQEAERRAIARDLHDTTGQALTAVRIQLELIRASAPLALVDRAVQQTDEATEEVRRAVQRLGARILDDVGLEVALRRLADDVAERTGIELEVTTRLPGAMPPGLESTCYRFVQEGLTNVARHAAASHVHIRCEQHGAWLHVVVSDDGRGFDPKAAHGGHGLVGLEERAVLSGGRFTVESAPGIGTSLKAALPLDTNLL